MRRVAAATALSLCLLVPLARAEVRVFDFNLAWSNQDLMPGAGVRTVGALFDGPTVARLTVQDITVDGQERVSFTLEALFAASGLPFGFEGVPPPSLGTLRFGAAGAVAGAGLASLLERTGPSMASAGFGSFSTTVTDGLDPAGDPNLPLQHGVLVNFTNRVDSSFNDGEAAGWQLPGRVGDFDFEGANRPLVSLTNFRVGSLPPLEYGGVQVENVAGVQFTGQVSAIPEPATAALWLGGLAALVAAARRRRG